MIKLESLVVLNPTTESKKNEVSLASRLSTLDGKVLGVVNNRKRNSDVFLNHLVKQLKQKYDIKDVLWIDKDHESLPMSDHMLEKLKSSQAVIAGVGD